MHVEQPIGTSSLHADIARSARPRGPDERWLLGILLAAAAAATALGLPYYLLAASDRVRSPLHPWLRPSGLLGQGFGILGLALFLFLWLYPLRKKLGRFRFLGSVGGWMRIHAVIGIALPALVAVHAGWRFRGLIGLGYAAMVLVSLSGLVGRYFYARIPRSRNGLELSRDEVAAQRRALVTEIAATLEIPPAAIEATLASAVAPAPATGGWAALRRLVLDDFERGHAVRRLERTWSSPRPQRGRIPRELLGRALGLARREITLAQQIRRLDVTHRFFHYWHVAHRPVAITALIAVLVHVAVAVLMGQTWLR